MKVISVIPLKKGAPAGQLTYFTSQNIPAGHVVSVPFRNKKILALVVSAAELERSKSEVKKLNFNLKKVAEDKGPSIFLPEFLATTEETEKYFALNKNSVLAALIPNVLIENYDKLTNLAPSSLGRAGERLDNLRSEKLLFQYPLADRISIYKTMIREAFARGQSVFLVVPTESDADLFAALLAKGIEKFCFVLHSGISPKKNLKAGQKIFLSEHPVLILATAPFLSLPRKDIGVVILERESSSAYRTLKKPYLDLRVFAELYAAKIGVKFILADDLLRLETIERQEKDQLHPLHPLAWRIEFEGDIEIAARTKTEDRKFKIFGDASLKEIERALQKKEKVFIFSLRKGLATMTVCKDCGNSLSCEDCASPLVLYISNAGGKRMFVCNRCERDWGADILCPNCGGWNLVSLGIGTDTVYEEIKKNFPLGRSPTGEPKATFFKLDKESAKSASGAKKIIKEFESEKGAVLIGTEMVFFYLKNRVPLSVVASFDSLWSIPNYKMGEKIIQLASKIASITERKIIIQTKNPEDPALQAIKSGNLLAFARAELADRAKLGYPPFSRFIKITHWGNKEETAKARKFLKEFLAEYSPEIFSGFVARLRGKYVTHALIRLEPKHWSLPALTPGSQINENLSQKLVSLPSNFEISVDPEDLL